MNNKMYSFKEVATFRNVYINTVYRWWLGAYLQYQRNPTKVIKGISKSAKVIIMTLKRCLHSKDNLSKWYSLDESKAVIKQDNYKNLLSI